jgi:hypothetical protein
MFGPLLTQSPVHAHVFEYGTIKTNLTVNSETLELNTEVSQKITAAAATSREQANQFQQYFSQNLTVTNQGKACTFKLGSFIHPAENQTIYTGSFTCLSRIENLNDLKIHSTLFADFFTNFNHFISLTLETQKLEIVFSPTQKDYPANTPHEKNNNPQQQAAANQEKQNLS